MILQALAGYYERLSQEGGTDIALEGFEEKPIPFLIILNKSGKFVDIQDTRVAEGKRKIGRTFLVPRAVKKTSGIAANFLWDTPNYVLARPKPDTNKDAKDLLSRANEQRQCFFSRIRDEFPELEADEGIHAVLTFLKNGDFGPVFAHPLWADIEETWANLTFKLEGELGLVCERPLVVTVVRGSPSSSADGEKQTCLITGSDDFPVRLHTAIKGIRKAQTFGANIVSFNLDAFGSYGKEQGFNAPVGRKAEFAYTTALNHMLTRDSRQKIQVGDATTVFWAENQSKMESAFANIFGEPPKGEPEQDYRHLISLFRSPESGANVELDRKIKFYVLGLSPNAARIAVRFWYAGTVGNIADNIWQHFDDLEIRGPEWGRIGLRWLLRSTALQGKDDNIPPQFGRRYDESYSDWRSLPSNAPRLGNSPLPGRA